LSGSFREKKKKKKKKKTRMTGEPIPSIAVKLLTVKKGNGGPSSKRKAEGGREKRKKGGGQAKCGQVSINLKRVFRRNEPGKEKLFQIDKRTGPGGDVQASGGKSKKAGFQKVFLKQKGGGKGRSRKTKRERERKQGAAEPGTNYLYRSTQGGTSL